MYIVVVVIVIAMSLLVGLPRRTRWAVATAMCVNLLSLIPGVALYCARAWGMHPVAQLSGSGATQKWLWSLWFNLWPCIMLEVIVGMMAVIGICVVIIVSNARSPTRDWIGSLLYCVVTIVHSAFALALIGSAFPDA